MHACPRLNFRMASGLPGADEAFASVLATSERLTILLAKLRAAQTRYCVFGGWLRDTVAACMYSSPMPRDVDLVAAGIDVGELIGWMPADIRPTMFGGVQSSAPPVPFDIWPLHETFLIRTLDLPISFESLLETADFSINAALYFPAQNDQPSTILDAGMLSALTRRHVAFNASVLPFPVMQCSRLAAYAAKLNLGFEAPVLAFMRRILENRANRAQVVDGLHRSQPQPILDKAIQVIALITGEEA